MWPLPSQLLHSSPTQLLHVIPKRKAKGVKTDKRLANQPLTSLVKRDRPRFIAKSRADQRLTTLKWGTYLAASGDLRLAEVDVKLQLQAEERGVVSIKGVCANRYLAMKEDGRLLASKCVTEECFFFERLESNNYNTYRSRKYSS
ncbi:hypothetical protein A6R68_17387, partial [Neotoma lepida]